MKDDEFGVLIAKSIAAAFLFMIAVVGLVILLYNVSGAKERDDNRRFDCKTQGGEMIYIKGTGDVCIKGVIKID